MKHKKQSTQTNSIRFHRLVVQIGEYMIAGGVWFWSGYVLIVVLDERIGLFWANFVGNAVGITLNFLLARFWVFKSHNPTGIMTATRRYVIYTALNAFLLNYLILQGLSNIGIKPAIGQFFAAGFFSVWNFVWYRAWVFKSVDTPRRIKHHA